MSEVTSATAIPREINLGLQKPVATPAYTRRFKSQAGTPVVNAGSQVTITLDTAQPGSFIDTLSSYISFKLRITNSQSDRGYNVSFSSCGAHSLIRAMRIYVQGVPIEEITEYNALVEWLHDLSGVPDYCDRSTKSRYMANTMHDDQVIYVPALTTREINIQLPLVSGVLGTMAEKMFPSMLVAPGNCYMQLDLATAAQAFKVQEIDVTGLIVSTAPPDMNADNLPPNMVARTSTGEVPSTYNSASSIAAYVGGGNQVLKVDAVDLLDSTPYDMPYSVGGTPDTNFNTGILTTEERIGGGMFFKDGAYASAVSPLNVNDKMWDYLEGGADAISLSNISTSVETDKTNKIFLGGGLSTNGAALGNSTRRMTESSSIRLDYQIVDVEYVGKQVVVGDDVARAIIERAAAGDISIHTQSYRQYPATISPSSWSYRVDPAYSNFKSNDGTSAFTITNGAPLVNAFQRIASPGAQSIIIPAKISSANAIYTIFRNAAGENDFRFDSLRRMTCGFTDNRNGTNASAQLRIGNELIPQSPIQSASEALEELLKAHHMSGHYGTCEKMGSITASSVQSAWPNIGGVMNSRGITSINTLSGAEKIPRLFGSDTDGALTTTYGGVYYPRNDFNSNIICPNPVGVSWRFPSFASFDAANASSSFFKNLNANCSADFYSNTSSGVLNYQVLTVSQTGSTLTAFKESYIDYSNREQKWKAAVRRAFFGYGDERSDHQITDPSKPNFMNPFKQHTGKYSNFMLGFDLDTFSHNTDVVRSGHYLGNNTVSLNLSNIVFEDNSPLNMPLCQSIKVDTFVLHDLRLSFQAGGIVQAFY